MRTPALLLATVIAAVFILPSTAAPCGCTEKKAPAPTFPCGCGKPPTLPPCGCGQSPAYVKSTESSSSTNSLAQEGSSSNVEISANAATGEYSKKASNSAGKSLARSGASKYEAFEARAGAPVCEDVLPARKCGECDKDYYLRVFVVDTKSAESVQAFYVKVFKQYKGETDKAYATRINFIFSKVYPTLDCRYNVKYIDLLTKYYTITYAKKSGETEREYITRVLTKTTETKEVYESKVTILQKSIRTVDWSQVKISYQSSTGFTFISDSTTSAKSTKSLDETASCTKTTSESEIVKTYAKLETEDVSTYFKRISTRSSEITKEQYTEKLNIIRKNYPCLDLWYNVKYIDFVKDYYTTLYTKQSCETEDVYYRRIITKETFETEVQTVNRVTVIHELMPNLPLWSDKKYYDTYTKKIYTVLYKKTESETQEAYYSRITKQVSTEKDEVYVNRVTLIKETFNYLPCWYSTKYLDVTTKFYTKKYTLKTSEKEEVLYTRIVTKETGETDELCAQRTHVIHTLCPNLPLWYEAKYYDTYTKKIYLITYKKTTVEDEKTYYSRICSQITKETDSVYVSRMTLIEETFYTMSLWSSVEYFTLTKKFYSLKYAKLSGECDEAYFKRLIAKEVVDTSTEIYAKRIHLVHLHTVSSRVWYEEKYYETFTKNYYVTYYKKIDKEACEAWVARVITVLAGECEEDAIKRITLIKKSTSSCGCWTLDVFNKLDCKIFSSAYLAKIKERFFVSSYESKASSSSFSTKSASGEEKEEVVVVKRGGC